MNTAPHPSNDAAADLFARRVAARMTQGTEDLPYDISERLRAARMQALAKRKVVAPVRKAAPWCCTPAPRLFWDAEVTAAGGTRWYRPSPSWHW